MNSKMKILVGVLVVGIVLIGGLFILKQIATELIEKPVAGGEIVDGLQLTIEPLNAAMEEYGVYIFRRNEPFKIKITLENKGNKDLNLLTPGMQNDYEKVFYFQIIDMNGTIIETDTRQVIMAHDETLGPEIIIIPPGESHSFFDYINSNEYGIEYHHFVIPTVFSKRFSDRYYRIRGIHDTTGYQDVNEIVVYSNDIIIEVVE